MSRWQNFRFRIHTPENENPKWWTDIFIIDTIVRDILSANGDEITLWRVHRRSARDNTGHQLTFHCYMDDALVSSISDAITQSEAFDFLRNHQLLREYLHDQAQSENIEDTSDGSWSVELRKSWPYYIHGVSLMLLDLIGQIKTRVASDIPSISSSTALAEVESFYVGLNGKLTVVWQQEGSHAFFHHINALFGYVPLIAQIRSLSGVLATF